MCVSFVGKFKILFLDTCTCQFDVRVVVFVTLNYELCRPVFIIFLKFGIKF